jgi:hypothetical protein
VWSRMKRTLERCHTSARRVAHDLTSVTRCPRPATLICAIDPELSVTFPEVRAHVLSCRACRARLDSLAEAIENIRAFVPTNVDAGDGAQHEVPSPTERIH